jgi:predicted nucleic acid-binding protein
MAYTRRLWYKIKCGEFEVVISDITMAEIDGCDELKKNTLYGYLAEINYTIIEADVESLAIAHRLIDLGILKQNNLNDCRHIAAAIVNECDAIVSWNFKHIVNHKTINGVKIVTTKEGYHDLLIYAPPMLAGDEEND